MANHDIQVNIESVGKFAKETRNTSLRLEEILNYLIQITSDVPNFFNTPSASVMQEALLKYLNDSKSSCNKLGDLSRKIEFFNKNYMNMIEATEVSVGGKL